MRLNRALARMSLAVLVGGLGACASTPLPPLSPPLPAQWRHPLPTSGTAPVDLHGWWRAFGDAELDALVGQALDGNLDVAQARERLRAARTLRSHAYARYLPSVRARTEDAIDPDASASFFVAGFDSTWELGLFGRGTANRRMAQGDLDAGAADLRAAQVSLVAEVAREWLGLRAAQQRERLLATVRDERRRQCDLLQVRQRLQLAAPSAVDQAQAALAQAEAALAEPRGAIDAGAQRLAVLLGRNEPDPQWTRPGPLPALGDQRIDAAPADLLRTRPEIARAEADVLRAAGEAGMARAEMYPNIGLGGSLVWSTDITSHRNHSVSRAIGSVGPILDIPLFDWGMRAAAAHARDHQLKASVLAYRQAVLQGVAEVETALGNLALQRRRERQDDDAVQALERIDAATGKRVALHLASPLERADSGIARAQAELERTDARAAHGLAYVALFKALGGAPLPAADGHAQEPR
ncbi:RND transporter [Frateuria sp. Soil773]|uniref:TolC family protein n=1 Tax=Frateuria sp. Soil773 TaxID=1736407 RepID=UPI0006F41129|nr:TolC family protein [Frateuria sp. Soil773]KRE88417.1 RND transporter [Frateuria sp. Soil773]